MREMYWEALAENCNGRVVEKHNVFDHYRFMEDIKKAYKKYRNDFDGFAHAVKSDLLYYYWSKCEWETVWRRDGDILTVDSLFMNYRNPCPSLKIDLKKEPEFIKLCEAFELDGKDKDLEKKIDVYDQVMVNWDQFIDYVWNMTHARARRKSK